MIILSYYDTMNNTFIDCLQNPRKKSEPAVVIMLMMVLCLSLPKRTSWFFTWWARRPALNIGGRSQTTWIESEAAKKFQVQYGSRVAVSSEGINNAKK